MKKIYSFIVFLLGLVSCVLFLYFKFNQNGLPLLLVTKLMPSALLCVWLIGNIRNNKNSILLLAGLVCSLFCDLFMELPDTSFQLFGILSNMIGLIFYIIYFIKSCSIRNYFDLAPITIIIMSVFSVIAPNLHELFIPVLVYCIIFIVFMWRSITRIHDPSITKFSKKICILGSVCLICSDSLLSFRMFSILPQSFVYVILIMMLWWIGLGLLAVTAGVKEK